MKHTSIFLLITLSSIAQQEEQLSQYMINPLFFNPGYAGSRNTVSIIANARFQWIGMKGAPRTQWLSCHSPIARGRIGIGGHLSNDQIGNRRRTSCFADISSGITINRKDDRLALGLSVGFDNNYFDFSDVAVNDVNDPFAGNRFESFQANVGTGMYFSGRKHYVGLSIPRLFPSRVKLSNQKLYTTAQHLYVTAGYAFELRSTFILKPSFLVKYTPHCPITIDLNMNALINQKIGTGIMYRHNESVGINFVVTLIRSFQVGYFFDMPINSLRTIQHGSHEILLQYDLFTSKKTQTSPRYF